MIRAEDPPPPEPLVQAALEDDLQRVQELFLLSPPEEQAGCLVNAAALGHFAIVEELLGRGVDPNAQAALHGLDGVAPALFFALYQEQFSIARLLVKSGANPSATEPNHGHSILAELVHDYAPIETLEIAMELGAPIDDQGESGYTPLGAALYRSRIAVAQWLIRAGAEPNHDRTISDALSFGGIVPLRMVLEAGADLNRRHESGATLLELAAEYNRPLHLNYLLWKGCDPSRLEQDLPLACSAGLVDAVRKLLIQDPHSVERPDRHGRTPLAMAAASNQTEVIRILLEADADPNQRFNCKWAPPDWGAMAAADHQLEAWNEDRASMLSLAVHYGNCVAAALYLDAGADPNLQDTGGWTPLHLACAGGFRELAELLITSGAELEALNEQVNTPFLIAVEWNRREVIRCLQSFHVDLTVVDGEGFSGLASAALHGHAELARELLDLGLDPDQRTTSGETPLMLAASNCHVELVRILLTHGADRSLKDPEGRTALQLAFQEREDLDEDELEDFNALLSLFGITP